MKEGIDTGTNGILIVNDRIILPLAVPSSVPPPLLLMFPCPPLLLMSPCPPLQEIERKGVDASCKSLFVLALLDRLVAEGHRTLIFSQSRVMLDILEVWMVARVGRTMREEMLSVLDAISFWWRYEKSYLGCTHDPV